MLHRVPARAFLTIICFAVAAVPALAGDDWKPVDPWQLALKEASVENGADAEAIFWEVQVDLDWGKSVFAHYIRIKIFTERGKELHSRIALRYSSRNKIEDIAGRTIKADGTIVDLKKESIFENTLVKLRGLKINEKRFAMPAVEPGAIIEYRWREVRHDSSGMFARLAFQRDIPIQVVKYILKPSQNTRAPLRTRAFNMKSDPPMMPEKDKRLSYMMTDVHAFHEEPHMPPEDEVRSWMLAYYSPLGLAAIDINKVIFDEYKSKMKVNDEVKQAALAAIGDASSPGQKLERIFEFCRTKIKNVNDDATNLTDDVRAKLKENKTPADTLKHGMGTGEDIDLLFGALANAVGFEARVARVADRSDIFFKASTYEVLFDTYFMRAYNIAVRVGNEWRFFDPASSYVPLGMLRWQEEGVDALIMDPNRPLLVTTPVSHATKSVQKRTAELRLSEDGALEGDVRMEYSGHFGVEKKEENDDDSAEQREKNLRDLIKAQMSTAELSNIRVENAADPVKPFVYSFHVRVPGYAQRSGKRLFLQPSFFQKGIAVLFSESKREHPIYFHYSWKDDDTVTINLPPGFALDNAEAPQGFTIGDLADYKVKIGVVGKTEALVYRRIFSFDGLLFPATSYRDLKQIFEAVHTNDNHTITLKQNAPAQ